MIQGTMSNAGKGILAAGLCRIFHQDDYKTAPFKSQNIALNSYITLKGLETGRAQTVQAEAAGIIPNVDMNPALLKPAADVGSQVIVRGISRGSMKAKNYFVCKKSLMPDIMVSYRRLEEQYDVIVIESVGSPAEVNLKTDDIVNMGMADTADAPALLVGDIDRGGVSAQLYSMVALLAEEERRQVKGLIINEFRGDRSVLVPGISMLEDLCGISVAGMIPYMDMDIEGENSLNSRLETGKGKAPAVVGLAVIRFPRISDFTGSNMFSGISGVPLCCMTRACDLGTPDVVILPGTENTTCDLLWMRQNGLGAAVLKLADRQVPVWGICGDRRMMGEVLVGEKGVEPDLPSRTSGMGLFLLEVESGREKIRTQVEGAFGQLDDCLGGLSGESIEGYEIYTGRTHINQEEGTTDTARIVPWRREPETCRPMDYVMETGKDGLSSRKVRMNGQNKENIYGIYVYGIFDNPEITRTIAEALAAARGLCPEQAADMGYRTYRRQQYDRLAEKLRENLDTATVCRIMGISQEGEMGISQRGKGGEKPDDGHTVGTGTVRRC